MKNKKFAVAITNCGGWNQVGHTATRDDLLVGRWGFFSTRKAADEAAKKECEWHSQFDDRGISSLVCRKTPRKGWVVVGQFDQGGV